jgi:Tol biopolymer transport system component
MSEGLAVSKKQLKIAYTQSGSSPEVTSQIIVADLDLTGPSPKIINQKICLKSNDKSCRLEPQDFFDEERQLTYFCYVPNGAFEVMGLNIATGVTTNFSRRPDQFNEPEGIFPDGRYTTVESDWQRQWLGGAAGSANIDIWKLKLDGTGKDFERLTHFNDYEGAKAANPVVSTDGKFMAFQSAKASDPPGTGTGILIYRFKD